MLQRDTEAQVEQALARTPAVALLGPRQVGKTTLARAVAAKHPGAVFVDLESRVERQRIREPHLVLPAWRDRLVVLDEVQLVPELFSDLRPEIDADRRNGRFLLLGSASGHLMQQASESLAGRISNVELPPLTVHDLGLGNNLQKIQQLWSRGGFPLSWTAAGDDLSFQWRLDMIETLLTRDLPAMGVRISAEALRRFWGMVAHLHGQLFNASQLGQALGGVAHTTIGRYLDLMVDAMVVRRLPPYFVNIGKRLVKAPKVYVRDTGLLHALLGLPDVSSLQLSPQAGASWEGFVVEQIAASLPRHVQLFFYRTTRGAELDLVLEAGQRRVGVEIKFSGVPTPARGFWQALKDLDIQQAFVVAPVEASYPIANGVTVLPVAQVGQIAEALVGRSLL